MRCKKSEMISYIGRKDTPIDRRLCKDCDYSFRLKSVASRAFQPKECSPTLNILPTTFYIAQDCGNNFIRCQRTINNNSILGAENNREAIHPCG